MSGFYSDEEAEEILRIAVSRSAGTDGITRDNLLLSASELGISPEAIAEAETIMRGRKADDAEREEFRLAQRQAFWVKAWKALVASFVLLAIDIGPSLDFPPSWSLAIMAYFVVRLALHAADHLLPNHPAYQAAFEEWKKQRHPKPNEQAQPHAELDPKVAANEVDQYATVHPGVFK